MIFDSKDMVIIFLLFIVALSVADGISKREEISHYKSALEFELRHQQYGYLGIP